MRFKIDWASLIVGSKFTVFALFYFVFEGNFPIASPREAYIWRGDLTEGFLRYRIGGLIFGGAYFRNFTVAYYIMCGYTGHFLFTVANDPFTVGNCLGACDRTFPRYIYHGKYPWLRQKEQRNRP